MPEAQREKPYFSLRKGLNTVSNEITFPDEFTSDELNYTIETDGSRRRRRGLAEEASGTTKTVVTIADGQVNQSYKWKSAGGDPAENLVVHQIGYTLYFTNDAEIISTTYEATSIDLSAFVVAAATTAATVGGEPCSFAVHRGYLVVTNKYITPLYITWDGTTLTTDFIQILVRDFEGIDDGVSIGTQLSTITDDHQYNLLNRGWTAANITDYKSNSTATVNPAKNQVQYLGYKRTFAANIYEKDGARSWDTAKMEAEIFQNSTAPQGSLFLDPTDTTIAYAVSAGAGDTPLVYVPSDFAASPSSNTTLTVPLVGHTYTTASPNIVITGQAWSYNHTGGGLFSWWGMNNVFYGSGPWTCVNGAPAASGEVQVNSANELIFFVDAISGWSSWATTAQDGIISGEDPITKSDGSALTVGPAVCEAFMGRVWYAGIDDQEWADTIFFSQIALKPASFGLCHQEADPTDELNNQLRHNDGGTLLIPNMGTVIQLKAVRNALLIFATGGVWEVSGGGRSPFTAANVSVRQITDAGCNSALSITQFESSTIYTSAKGVISLSPNQFTSQLEASNMTADIIEDTWNAIPATDQQNIQTAYDDAKKRLYVLYRDASTLTHTYNKALVYDLKNQGWYRLGFNFGAAAGIVSMFSISDADSSESNQKMKFQCQITTTTVDTCDMNQSAYLDFDGVESPLPYLVTGWEASYGFQRRKQAPIVAVFNKRTGTGWTDSNGWTEDNGGSTLMTPFWDWTEATQWDVPALPTAQEPWDATANNFGVSGKIGKQVETYRFVRNFTPLTGSNVDGYPVIATRNKVRGRGRSLSMRFDGAATKDSHLLGFTINYKITRKK